MIKTTKARRKEVVRTETQIIGIGIEETWSRTSLIVSMSRTRDWEINKCMNKTFRVNVKFWTI
jgi:hypothetical protein